jgi:hypothetical protein
VLQLRAQIVRDGLEGLEHVEAMPVLRGIGPAALHVPRKFAQRRDTSRLALEALRTGRPKRYEQVSRYASFAIVLTYELARARMNQALHGLVAEDDRC